MDPIYLLAKGIILLITVVSAVVFVLLSYAWFFSGSFKPSISKAVKTEKP